MWTVSSILSIIRARRTQAGISQQGMADMLELSREGYGLKERGLAPFTFDEVARVAQVLGLTLVELVGEGAPPSSELGQALERLIDARVEAAVQKALSERGL